MENSRIDEYKKFGELINKYFSEDSVYTKAIRYNFNAIIGDFYYKTNQHDSAFEYYLAAYNYNKLNVNLNNNLCDLVIKVMETDIKDIYYEAKNLDSEIKNTALAPKNAFEATFGMDSAKLLELIRGAVLKLKTFTRIDTSLLKTGNIFLQSLFVEYYIVYPMLENTCNAEEFQYRLDRTLNFCKDNKYKITPDNLRGVFDKIVMYSSIKGYPVLAQEAIEKLLEIYKYDRESLIQLKEAKTRLTYFIEAQKYFKTKH